MGVVDSGPDRGLYSGARPAELDRCTDLPGTRQWARLRLIPDREHQTDTLRLAAQHGECSDSSRTNYLGSQGLHLSLLLFERQTITTIAHELLPIPIFGGYQLGRFLFVAPIAEELCDLGQSKLLESATSWVFFEDIKLRELGVLVASRRFGS